MWRDFKNDPIGQIKEFMWFIYGCKYIPYMILTIIPKQLNILYKLTMHPAMYEKPEGF